MIDHEFILHKLYAVISYSLGVTPVYIPVAWKIMVPPKIQVFLWLLSRNRLGTVDKPEQSRHVQTHTLPCLFCKVKYKSSIFYLGNHG
jgi:hypothetical protein